MYIPSAVKLATIINAFSDVIESSELLTELIIGNNQVSVLFDHQITENHYNALRTFLGTDYHVDLSIRNTCYITYYI
jgi:hypothetical protein